MVVISQLAGVAELDSSHPPAAVCVGQPAGNGAVAQATVMLSCCWPYETSL